MAALEALACGTPVIARAAGGLTDLLDGRAAIGVERDDVGALADAISAVAPIAGTLRDDARRRALEFDADLAFARLLKRYTALCFSVRPSDAQPKEERYAA